jgi:hypothetical protein
VFVITGDTILFNGISISRDGGRTFAAGIEVFEDRQTEFNIGARYGAFPTESAWYVSGGRFPTTSSRSSGGGTDDKEEEEEEEGQEFHISENIHLRKHGDGSNSTTKNNGSSSLRFTPQHEGAQEAAADPTNPYTAGIAKSEDGGATWRTIFESVDEGYYFNQISCFDVRKTPLLLSLFVLEMHLMPSFYQDRLGTKHSRDSSTPKRRHARFSCRRSAAWSLRREGVTRRSSPPRTAGA